MLLLSNESEIYEIFDFRLNGFHNLVLLVWLHLKINIKPVHGNLRVQTRHVFVTSGEDVYVLVHGLYQVFILR